MAEALGVAGSVISFIGFAGQILQGCQYAHSFLNDIQDASDDFKALKNEVFLFEEALREFQCILNLAEAGGHGRLSSNPQSALCYCELAVEKLKKLVKKHDKKCKALTRKFLLAWRKKMFEKRVTRLRTASAHLRTVQANIISYLHLDQGSLLNALNVDHQLSTALLTDIRTRQEASLSLLEITNRNIQGLKESQNDRLNNQCNTHALLSNTKGRNEALHTNTLETINTLNNSSSATVERLQQLEKYVTQQHTHAQEIEQIVTVMQSEMRKFSAAGEANIIGLKMDMQHALQSLKGDISTELQTHRVNSSILESTIRRVLSEELCHILSNTAFQPLNNAIDIHTRNLAGSKDSDLIDYATQPQEKIMIAEAHGIRTQKLCQARTSRTYRTWIGDITVLSISSSTSKSHLASNTRALSTSSRIIRVTIQPKAHFVKKHVSSEIIWQRSLFGHFSLTIRNLRTWNTVREDSAIVKACKGGDVSTVLSLFTNRAASPFDYCGNFNRVRSGSLIDVVNEFFLDIILGIWHTFEDESPLNSSDTYALLNNYLEIFQVLINNGLDIGEIQDSCGRSNLIWSSLLDHGVARSLIPVAAQYVRLILRESKADPFFKTDELYPSAGIGWAAMVWYSQYTPDDAPICSILLQQEYWYMEWPDPLQACNCTLKNFERYLDDEFSSLEIIAHDPECLTLRPLLQVLPEEPSLAALAAKIMRTDLFGLEPIFIPKVEKGIRNRLALLFERGLDPRATKRLGNYDSITLTDHARSHLLLDLWSSALFQSGWTDSDITVLLEEDVYASLTYQLFQLEVAEHHSLSKRLQYVPINSEYWDRYLDRCNNPAPLFHGITNPSEEDSPRQVVGELEERPLRTLDDSQVNVMSTWTIPLLPSYFFLFKLTGLPKIRGAGSIYTDFSWQLPITVPTRVSDAIVSAMQDYSIVKAYQKVAVLQERVQWRAWYSSDADLDPSEFPIDGELAEPIKDFFAFSTLPRIPGCYYSFPGRDSGSIYRAFCWKALTVRLQDAPGTFILLLSVACLRCLVTRKFKAFSGNLVTYTHISRDEQHRLNVQLTPIVYVLQYPTSQCWSNYGPFGHLYCLMTENCHSCQQSNVLSRCMYSHFKTWKLQSDSACACQDRRIPKIVNIGIGQPHVLIPGAIVRKSNDEV